MSRASASIPLLLRELDHAVGQGLHAAGYLAYEASAGLGLPCRPAHSDGPPLASFGLFDPPVVVDLPASAGTFTAGPWQPTIDLCRYAAAVSSVHDHLARGDSYQVNLTFPLTCAFSGDPFALFLRLHAAQRTPHSAYLDIGRYVVASASPELFFLQDGSSLAVRPMKGTARRGLTREEDEAQAKALLVSSKDRAENVMIADMMRNDLGRVAETGSVRVTSLFEVEAYPTLFQMVSTVRAQTRASSAAVLEALFPSASVTGAPRHRTMQIIARLETEPRGVYTGAIGWMAPGPKARFSVAIRSAVVDRQLGRAVYGVGSGIVADSSAEAEYAECLLKARVLDEEPFSLLEALRFEPGLGLLRIDAHLERLGASARRFGFPLNVPAARDALAAAVVGIVEPAKVRLVVAWSGSVCVEARPLNDPRSPPWDQSSSDALGTLGLAAPRPDLTPPFGSPGFAPIRLGLARVPVSSRDPWLRHKTTHRAAYDQAIASRPDCEDVLLWNDRGEVTETSIANVVVWMSDGLTTPALDAGLLPGILRAEAIRKGHVREGTVRVSDLAARPRMWLVSAVRGWREAVLTP